MRRRDFITLTGGAGLTSPFASSAQDARRAYRLGYLGPFPREEPASSPFLELPRRGLAEGQNLAIYYRASCRRGEIRPNNPAKGEGHVG